MRRTRWRWTPPRSRRGWTAFAAVGTSVTFRISSPSLESNRNLENAWLGGWVRGATANRGWGFILSLSKEPAQGLSSDGTRNPAHGGHGISGGTESQAGIRRIGERSGCAPGVPRQPSPIVAPRRTRAIQGRARRDRHSKVRRSAPWDRHWLGRRSGRLEVGPVASSRAQPSGPSPGASRFRCARIR